ncbi:XdhC family protein [Streptomyces sp. VRA16 Mangrove soil]|uniref:XdhC family protein n=1 Tax=Streptomyces sp. VRA16 Mangrove soil TaxID=2817434 RepID=UPI001A9E31A1|nr:XdhC/CoxI family protein [Streptomyces sp. VRA16 Mangrove soil]MBO1331816.1 XdhC family protein [Streptomyces sp. VRA16 Mangrove soil]
MRHVIDQAAAWQSDGVRFALATVVHTAGSAPHPVGTSMLVAADGRVVGSVSGGCVEAAVCALAEEVLAGAGPARETYGVSDDDAFAVGLTCGGTIEVTVREMTAQAPLGRVAAAVAARAPVALVTPLDGDGGVLVVDGAGPAGSLGDPRLDRAAADAAAGLLPCGESGVVRVGEAAPGPDCAPERDVFVRCFGAPPRLLVFGAVDFARPLVRIGALLGYRTTVCDARPAFATRERFPEADEVVAHWPHRWLAAHENLVDATTAVCVLTHDARFDVPLLAVALRGRAGYVGAMGSRRTHEDRLARLREAGLDAAALDRLRSPIGLDLGGRGPEETAVSIAAEIVAARRGGSGRPLGELTGPVHAAARNF